MMDLQEEINIVLDEPLLVPGTMENSTLFLSSSTDEAASPSRSPQQSRLKDLHEVGVLCFCFVPQVFYVF